MSAPAQTPPSPPNEAVIVSLDPEQPFAPKPLVADILRTRFCIPGSIFLVENIDSCLSVGSGYRAVRLILGDGDLCVQALLNSEMHGFVDDGQVYAGCYVRVDKFKARWVDLVGGMEDAEDDGAGSLTVSRKRKRAEEKMVYLIVEDLVTVGWNNAYLRMLGKRPRKAAFGAEVIRRTNQSIVAEVKGGFSGDEPDRNRGPSQTDRGPALSHSKAPAEASEVDLEEISEAEFKVPDVKDISDKHVPGPACHRHDPPKRQANVNRRTQDKGLPWASDDPTKPLKLTALQSIPTLPYKQNWMVNILAVVASLSEVEPSHFPPYHQRTARLADPTTSKQVLLTVFLDPDDFNPKVGSVVLILGVKNHTSDGGSLKKYCSDRPKHGRRWWFEEPTELGWCDVAGLRAWWDGTQRGDKEPLQRT